MSDKKKFCVKDGQPNSNEIDSDIYNLFFQELSLKTNSVDCDADNAFEIISTVLNDESEENCSENTFNSPFFNSFPIEEFTTSLESFKPLTENLTLTEKIQVNWNPQLYELCHKCKDLFNFSDFVTRKIFLLYRENPNVSWNDFLIIRENIMPNPTVKNYSKKRQKLLEAFDKLKDFIKYKKFNLVGDTLSTLIKFSKFYENIGYAQSAQQINKVLGANWQTFQTNLKNFYNHELEFRPNIPRFKPKDGEFMMIYTKQTIYSGSDKFKEHIEKTKRTTHYKKYSKTTAELLFPKRHRDLLPIIRVRYDILKNLREVRIIPKGSYYEIEIRYNKETKNYGLCQNNALTIDLGANNPLAITNNFGLQPILIHGKQFKQINHFINKKSPPLKSIISICHEILKKKRTNNKDSITYIVENHEQKHIKNYQLIENLVNILINNPDLTYEQYKTKNFGNKKVKQIFNHIKTLPDNKTKLNYLDYQFTELERKEKIYSRLLDILNKKHITEHEKSVKNLLDKNQHSLNNLYRVYNNKTKDAIHKMTRYVIHLCEKYDIGIIVIGYNEGWKTSSKLKKAVNRKFIPLPFYKLINTIKYKGELVGISIIITEESYTSKCSALDKESIKFHEKYAGERNPTIIGKDGEPHKHYGQFFSYVSKKYIHSDINGAFNIGRKGAPHLFEDIPQCHMLIPPIRIAVT